MPQIDSTEKKTSVNGWVPPEEKLLAGQSEEVIFLRLPKVRAMTGLSKSSLYDLMRAKSFPAPVQLGPRTVAWVSSEVRQWAADRISTSRSTHRQVDLRPAPRGVVSQSWRTSKRRA